MLRLVTLVLVLAVSLAAARSVFADWLPVDLPYGDYLSEPITALAAPGPSDVWAVTTYGYYYQDEQHARWNSNLYHSKNDGLLWDLPFDAPASQTDPIPNQFPFQDTQLYAVAFADRDNGWLFGWQKPTFGINDSPGAYTFYHTTDRGRTWAISTLPNTEPTPDEPDFALEAVDATHCYAVQGRHVFETTDGIKWTERVGVYPRLFSVQAGRLATPRAAGVEGTSGVGGALSLSAFVQDVKAPGAFYATRFADDAVGWVAGGSATAGSILATADGGRTWKTQLAPVRTLFRGLAAPTPTNAWAVGYTTGDTPFGVVYRTIGTGSTWTLDGAVPGRLFAVAFRDVQHGWAAGDEGLWRYVPSVPVVPGDLDHSAKPDLQDVVAILRRAAGVQSASPTDVAAANTLTVRDAVRVLKSISAAPPSGLQDDPARVVIVYNTVSTDSDANGVGDSLRVAQYYAQARGVPTRNLVPITWQDAEAFQNHGTTDGEGRANWTDAFRAICEPLQATIDGIGRSSVDTILFCIGVPYKFNVTAPDGTWDAIPLDTAVNDLYRCDAENWSSGSPWYAPLAGAPTRYGRSRFETGARPLGQPVAGPTGAGIRDPWYLVSRIDGPSLDVCLAMVDNALFAEQYRGPSGFDGTAYIDTRAVTYNGAPYSLPYLRSIVPSFYNYADIDKSIARTVLTFDDRGLAWKDEVTDSRIGDAATGAGPFWRNGTAALTAPRAMFYAGWYNYGTYNDVWDWLPGSVGIDYDSASAYNFRGSTYFAGGALSHGLTALVGVLGEPYNYHPKPDALMEYLARGFNFAEAAMLCTETPRTAKAIFLGDPLYRPFRPHDAAPVPVPTLTVSTQRTSSGWTVLLATDIPVKATLKYTTDGSDPIAFGQMPPVQPGYYALRHSWNLPFTTQARYFVKVIDPTERDTASPVLTLP